jgi:hypothetical protein
MIDCSAVGSRRGRSSKAAARMARWSGNDGVRRAERVGSGNERQ